MSKRKRYTVQGESVAGKSRLNDKGQEVLNDAPVTLPVRYQRGDNITERVQRMVEETISRRAEMAGLETLDDANDFDVGDDYDPRSEHEVDEDAEAEYFRQRGERDSGWFKRKAAAPSKGKQEPEGEGKPAGKSVEGSGAASKGGE